MQEAPFHRGLCFIDAVFGIKAYFWGQIGGKIKNLNEKSVFRYRFSSKYAYFFGRSDGI